MAYPYELFVIHIFCVLTKGVKVLLVNSYVLHRLINFSRLGSSILGLYELVM